MKNQTFNPSSFPAFLEKMLPFPFYALCFFGILFLGISSFKPNVPATVSKIAVVDLDIAVAKSRSGKALQLRLENFQNQVKAEGETMTEQARALRQRIADGANSLSQDKLAEMQKQYEDKMINIRRFQDDKQREGQKMQQDGLMEIEKEMEPVFQKLVSQHGVDLVFGKVPGVVIYSNESVDFTDALVDLLNE